MGASKFNFEAALEEFEAWYEKCLDAGIEPEVVVEAVGEMKLLVNQEQVDAYERGCE